MNKINYLWAIPALLALSVLMGIFGSETTKYGCKYVDRIEVKVADTEKYADAVYVLHFKDGTTGASNSLGRDSGPQGIHRGEVCKTVFQWGWPYSFTNRDVKDAQ